MSVRAISYVLEHSRARGSTLLTLIVLADAANQEGLAWPSQKTLARLSRLSDRSVRRALAELVRLGEIEVVGKTAGGVVVYRILGLDAVKNGQEDEASSDEEAKAAPPDRLSYPPRTICPPPDNLSAPPDNLSAPPDTCVRQNRHVSVMDPRQRHDINMPHARSNKRASKKKPPPLFDLRLVERAEAVVAEVEERIGRLDILVRAGQSRKHWREVLIPWLVEGYRAGGGQGAWREGLVRRAVSETLSDLRARRSDGKPVIRGPAGAYFWGVLRGVCRAAGAPIEGEGHARSQAQGRSVDDRGRGQDQGPGGAVRDGAPGS